MSLSNRREIYASGKKLGLSTSDIDSFINSNETINSDFDNAGSIDTYKAGTKYGSVGSSDIYKAGTHYGTVAASDIYKAGTMYGSVSPKDF